MARHDVAALPEGVAVPGPAVIEIDTTAVLLPPGDVGRMTGRQGLEASVTQDAQGSR